MINFQTITNWVSLSRPFSFSRWGDGEFKCMRMEGGQNCDSHAYFDTLGAALWREWEQAERIHEAPLIHGIQPLAERVMADEVRQHRKTLHYSVMTNNADVLHNASMAGNLVDLVESCAESDWDVVLVGPQRLNALGFADQYLNVRDVNCWLDYDWLRDTLAGMRKKIVLYSSSMMTNVLIGEMYRLNGNELIQIDCGSVWEPYVGYANRKYHNEMKGARLTWDGM